MTASFAPALPAFTAPVVTMLPTPRKYPIPSRNFNMHPSQEWMLDALLENMKNQPPLDGSMSLSLHTGKYKIGGWDADKVNAIIFGDDPDESAKPAQRETKLLPDRQ